MVNMHQNHGYLIVEDDVVLCTLRTWEWLILVVVKTSLGLHGKYNTVPSAQ
jgi:hypothetical protein